METVATRVCDACGTLNLNPKAVKFVMYKKGDMITLPNYDEDEKMVKDGIKGRLTTWYSEKLKAKKNVQSKHIVCSCGNEIWRDMSGWFDRKEWTVIDKVVTSKDYMSDAEPSLGSLGSWVKP